MAGLTAAEKAAGKKKAKALTPGKGQKGGGWKTQRVKPFDLRPLFLSFSSSYILLPQASTPNRLSFETRAEKEKRKYVNFAILLSFLQQLCLSFFFSKEKESGVIWKWGKRGQSHNNSSTHT